MSLPFPRWLRLPSRVALLIGLGALSTAGARADTDPSLSTGTGERLVQNEHGAGQLRVWDEGGQVYVSEDGGPAQALPLSDSAESRRLRRLLQERGTAWTRGATYDRMILAGGGGAGFDWAGTAKSRTQQNVATSRAALPSKAKTGGSEQVPTTSPVRARKTTPEGPGVKG
jgi:hypothetical protein